MLKFDLESTKIRSVGVTIDYIDIHKIAQTVKKLCKILHSLRQDALRQVLTLWHPAKKGDFQKNTKTHVALRGNYSALV